jgi:hypothetical protein
LDYRRLLNSSNNGNSDDSSRKQDVVKVPKVAAVEYTLLEWSTLGGPPRGYLTLINTTTKSAAGLFAVGDQPTGIFYK